MSPATLSWVALMIAICFEVAGSSALLKSAQFTRLWPTVIMLICYGCAFYGLSLALRHIPLGVAYAIWSGVGIVLTALIAWGLFGQKLDTPALIGIGFILTGVMIMNVFSKTATHG
ncbi:DMT family transporter [Falsigemmobacter intermedius]|uniref:QacE family quaternary ammonium compound efflux SMR transporter n=1 Tax=Falsigemmobacter intermedius TaxID=1553448 RepID=A0A3S3V4Q7_9RHOB|nr:SMR family transporter [Falsigemmobacter intermedius]RWY41671.1 QacE family quaternary ammonium compound efflux SMR transporter [Falsigemmobacter intermedius]